MEPSEWNRSISSLPGAHVLQTWEWGQVKEAFGWKALPKDVGGFKECSYCGGFGLEAVDQSDGVSV